MKRSRAQIGRLSRTKGRTFEQFVAKSLRPYFEDARRQPQSQIKQLKAIASRDDVLAARLCLTDVVAGPFAIECKHRKALPHLEDTIKQAIEDTGNSGLIPVAVHKPSPGTLYDIQCLVYYFGELKYMSWIEFVANCERFSRELSAEKSKGVPVKYENWNWTSTKNSTG